MGLHHHKTRQRPGLPEFVAVVLAFGASIPAFLWYQGEVRAAWQRTTGRVTRCDIRETHYNATDQRPKVDVLYEYDVAGASFAGSWTGYWPETEEQSPNALLPEQLNGLCDSGYPLVVFYDPDDPAKSIIHTATTSRIVLYKWVFGGLFVIAVYYIVRVYPAWKRSDRTALYAP